MSKGLFILCMLSILSTVRAQVPEVYSTERVSSGQGKDTLGASIQPNHSSDVKNTNDHRLILNIGQGIQSGNYDGKDVQSDNKSGKEYDEAGKKDNSQK